MNNSPDPRQSQFGTALAPDPDLAVSAAFDKRFVIEGSLTKSETRLVYLARDLRPQSPDHERLVRLQVLPERLSSDPRQVELFRLESCAAAKLSHRNILPTSEAEEMNGVFFCVAEERPDLQTLRDRLRIQGWMSTDEVLRVGRQIADALEYAHRQGVLHLTLNPEVVLLAQGGTVLVRGFGIGCHREMTWAQQERSRYCMPQYISPEQILSAGIGRQSDLYLLGLILYEMLTDRAPFESEDRASLLRKHLTRTPPAPHDFRREVSREVSRLVLNLLSKRPDERPSDVTAFISVLEDCITAGLTADVEEEEVAPPALADDLMSPPEEFEFGLSSEARDFEESESPYESWLAPAEPWELGTDNSESAAGGAPGGEVFQDVVVQRDSSNEEYHHPADL
jgi:serine/threonine protein kinase